MPAPILLVGFERLAAEGEPTSLKWLAFAIDAAFEQELAYAQTTFAEGVDEPGASFDFRHGVCLSHGQTCEALFRVTREGLSGEPQVRASVRAQGVDTHEWIWTDSMPLDLFRDLLIGVTRAGMRKVDDVFAWKLAERPDGGDLLAGASDARIPLVA